MTKTVIIAATEIELFRLIEHLDAKPDKPLLDFPAYHSGDSILVISGPGMANAAAAAAAAIERYQPGRIFNIGICGCYSKDKSLLGTPVIGTRAIFADTGSAGLANFLPLESMSLPLCRSAGQTVFNTVLLNHTEWPQHLPRAEFLTVSSVSAERAIADRLCGRFKAQPDSLVCEDMESAAVALIAFRSGIPCTVVRGISNICGQRDHTQWRIPEAAQSAQEALCSLLIRHEIPALRSR